MSNGHNVTKLGFIVIAAGAIAGCQDAVAPLASPAHSPSSPTFALTVQSSASKHLIKDQYIVVFRDGYSDVDGRSRNLVARTKGKLNRTFKAGLKGFGANMSTEEAAALATDPSVAYVEQDQTVTADGVKGGGKVATVPGTFTQTSARWNLDRIDQTSLPLNSRYTYSATGSGVNVYIVDTGIRSTHAEFGARATLDFSAINDGYGPTGCHWHGTHVGGTVGGTTVGVAKAARLHSVRVLDCNAQGSWTDVISGIDWVTANAVLPAVMNISISGGYSAATNDAVSRAVAAGITVVVAAGNYAGDACSYSPYTQIPPEHTVEQQFPPPLHVPPFAVLALPQALRTVSLPQLLLAHCAFEVHAAH